MPTNTQRLLGVITTAGLLIGGGWMASQASHARPTTSANTPTGPDAAESSAPRILDSSIEADTIVVTLEGLRSDSGLVHVGLFNEASAFRDFDVDRAVDFVSVPAGQAAITFRELQGGPYAISVHHDENANAEFDMISGYPVEGYGTSNAATAMDDLTFEEASVPGGPIAVSMFYLD